MLYTSRSAIECYQQCPRKRWLQYFYGGRGIVQKWANVPFTTGTCVHKGIEFLLKSHQQQLIEDPANCESWVDKAVRLSLAEYTKLVGDEGLMPKMGEDSEFVFRMEQAKTEALVRAWAIAEFPTLTKHFEIYSVEDELVIPLPNPFLKEGNKRILLQARIDAIIKDKQLGDFYNYSLKTMRNYQEGKTDRTFSIALQNITEVWAVEKYFDGVRKTLGDFWLLCQKRVPLPKLSQLRKFTSKYLPEPPSRVSGTKFCFLIKGGKLLLP
jgi:hypothetical protein